MWDAESFTLNDTLTGYRFGCYFQAMNAWVAGKKRWAGSTKRSEITVANSLFQAEGCGNRSHVKVKIAVKDAKHLITG